MNNETLMMVLRKHQKNLKLEYVGYDHVIVGGKKIDIQDYYIRTGIGALRNIFMEVAL